MPVRIASARLVRWLLLVAGALLIGYALRASFAARHTNPPPLSLINPGFETGDLTGWHKTGDAFDFQPTLGDNPKYRDRETAAPEGDWWIGGYEKYQGKPGQQPGDAHGDPPTGTLTSEVFTLVGERLSFLIGAGRHPCNGDEEKPATCVRLIVDGQVVRRATGNNSETMRRHYWNIGAYAGKQAQLQLLDSHTGGWGHINFDDVRLVSRWQAEGGQLLLMLWTGSMLALMAFDPGRRRGRDSRLSVAETAAMEGRPTTRSGEAM